MCYLSCSVHRAQLSFESVIVFAYCEFCIFKVWFQQKGHILEDTLYVSYGISDLHMISNALYNVLASSFRLCWFCIETNPTLWYRSNCFFINCSDSGVTGETSMDVRLPRNVKYAFRLSFTTLSNFAGLPLSNSSFKSSKMLGYFGKEIR